MGYSLSSSTSDQSASANTTGVTFGSFKSTTSDNTGLYVIGGLVLIGLFIYSKKR